MPRQVESYDEGQYDVIEQLISPSIEKLGQLTDVPDGCIVGFSGMAVNNVVGTKRKGKKVLYASEFVNNFCGYRRSKNGDFWKGVLKLALEKTISEGGTPEGGTEFMAQ